MNNNMQWITKVMAANGLEAAGPVRIVTNEFGSETYSFDVTQPVRKIGATGPVTKLDIKLEGRYCRVQGAGQGGDGAVPRPHGQPVEDP